MPAIGFGTWRLWAKDAYQPVRWALEAGYRHIDTAEGYANEAEIGRAISHSGVPRSELYIATKASSVPKGLNEIQHMADVFASQLQMLGTDYVDMYMLHTMPLDPTQLRTIWSVMEQLYESGHARALGVSNVDANDLRDLLSFARVRPAYVQNLFKVYKPGEQMSVDVDIVSLAHSQHIAVMGYSVQTEWPHVLPPLSDPHVLSIASRMGRTASQVLHRWALQRGVGVIPKSSSQARIIENARLLDFELPENAMRLLDGLATLSESGAPPTIRPVHQEDVYQLSGSGAHVFGVQHQQQQHQQQQQWPVGGQPPPAFGHSQVAAAASMPADADSDLTTRNIGFPFAAIRNNILGPAADISVSACRARCIGEPACTAWEVCAPVDEAAGCGGCLLIGGMVPPTMQIQGWHAAIERNA